ncbi:MAG: hypothetical protein ACW986_08795 [Promethearchaeota archaeon]|jgi:hypothetical protein
MVKVPIGEIVVVDLWNSKKKRGMVKYNTNTMDLVRAESEFDLYKGDLAIVVESHDSFVLIVPKDEYTEIVIDDGFKRIDIKQLIDIIFNILKEREKETGGILSFEDLYSILKRTSIQSIITKKHLIKAGKYKDVPFDRLKESGRSYFALKPTDCPDDEVKVLKIAENNTYVTKDLLQRATNWSDLRINRILDHLVRKKRSRKDSTYLNGDRYFFHIS